MTDKAVRVGDVVAWDDVPVMALCQPVTPSHATSQHFLRRDELLGTYLGGVFGWWDIPRIGSGAWIRWFMWKNFPQAKIIALNLTGNETADELRALAEAFEREHPTT